MSDLRRAVEIMAEATSHFVQDPYATEGLEALVEAGWTIAPPEHHHRQIGYLCVQGHPKRICSGCTTACSKPVYVETEQEHPEYEYATVRSDDAAKWVGRDGWEKDEHTVVLRRAK